MVCARMGNVFSGPRSDGSVVVGSPRVVGARPCASSSVLDGFFEDCPRLATIAAASAAIGEVIGLLGSSTPGVDWPDLSLGNRGPPRAGDRCEGNVLLRWTAEDVVGVANAGVSGLGTAPECRERFEDVDTFLRTPPYFRKLSAPALEDVDADLPMPELLRPGVVGDLA
jgi:hypothetical protein